MSKTPRAFRFYYRPSDSRASDGVILHREYGFSDGKFARDIIASIQPPANPYPQTSETRRPVRFS